MLQIVLMLLTSVSLIGEPRMLIDQIVADISVKEEVMEYDNLELIALICMAEAEGEPEEGKRWVIDSILNRVDSGYFPNTVYDVIYQPNQYSCVSNGRSDRCYVNDDIYRLVEEEIKNRTNSDCVFFRTNSYHSYGKPIAQVGNHYFSSYN